MDALPTHSEFEQLRAARRAVEAAADPVMVPVPSAAADFLLELLQEAELAHPRKEAHQQIIDRVALRSRPVMARWDRVGSQADPAYDDRRVALLDGYSANRLWAFMEASVAASDTEKTEQYEQAFSLLTHNLDELRLGLEKALTLRAVVEVGPEDSVTDALVSHYADARQRFAIAVVGAEIWTRIDEADREGIVTAVERRAFEGDADVTIVAETVRAQAAEQLDSGRTISLA